MVFQKNPCFGEYVGRIKNHGHEEQSKADDKPLFL